MPQSFDYDSSLLGLKKLRHFLNFDFFCNSQRHPPELAMSEAEGFFLPNATLVCKVHSGLVKV